MFVKTGLPEMDRMLEGGFPAKTLILVSGEAGCGKTLFGLNFVVQGAKAGEKCCYVSLGETEEELLRACSHINGLKDAEAHIKKNLIFKHIQLGEKTSLEELTKIFSMYPEMDRLVVDNVNKLLMHASNKKDYRLKLSELMKYLKEKAKCSLLLCETGQDDIDSGNGEAFEADGVIKLSFLELEEKPKRILQIYKLRYSGFDPRVSHELSISKNGIILTSAKFV